MGSPFSCVQRSHPRGASLVYTIIIVTVMLVTVSSVVDSIIRANRQYEDLGRSDQAEKAARALMERAFLEATTATSALGYETATGNSEGAIVTQELFDTNGDGDEDVYGTYEIWARAKPIDWRTNFVDNQPYANYTTCGSANPCIAPIPGTGNAGSDCDFTDPSQGWAPSATVTTAQALDNDCNWNKLHYGEVVSFPLYYEDDPTICTGGICNPADAPMLGTFTLRVRTPDTDGDGMRETLNEDVDINGDGTGDGDQVVVNWEITGDCDTNNDDDADDPMDKSCWMIGNESAGSLIHTSTVNDATGWDEWVVTGGSAGEMHTGDTGRTIVEFLTSDESSFIGMEILNPLLTLSVVSPLENTDPLNPGSVPYLEYQIQVDKPISDNKSSIHTIGKAEGKLGTYVWPLLDYLGIAENPLVQFVIQN